MILIHDIHRNSPQAMLLNELAYFLEDMQIAREAYLKRVALREKFDLEHS